MCGIIGYVGNRASKDLLIQGLERLEFRGYDSAGHRARSRTTGSSTFARSGTSRT